MASSITPTISSKHVKRVAMIWCKMIENGDRYYVAKAMDLFYDLPASHQKHFLAFISDKHSEQKSWGDRLHDPAEYSSIIKSVLFYYSGRIDAGQPNKEEFKNEIVLGYLKSQYYRDAETVVAGSDNLTEMLEGI